MSVTAAPEESPAPQSPQASVHTVLGVTERLQQSRRLMRDHMLKLNAAHAQAAAQASGPSNALLATLIALPLVGPLVNRAVSWWEGHPLHAVADLFTQPNASTAEPLTRRHPWAMLLGAAALGALLVWARPWRYPLFRRAIVTGVLPPMIAPLLARLSTDGLLDLVTSLLRRSAAAPSPPPDARQQPAAHDGTAPDSTLH